MKHQMWVDQRKVRERFGWYRRRIAQLDRVWRGLEDELKNESQSVNYYRDKWNEARQETLRVRRQGDDDKEEADRARYAAQEELDRCRRAGGTQHARG